MCKRILVLSPPRIAIALFLNMILRNNAQGEGGGDGLGHWFLSKLLTSTGEMPKVESQKGWNRTDMNNRTEYALCK